MRLSPPRCDIQEGESNRSSIRHNGGRVLKEVVYSRPISDNPSGWVEVKVYKDLHDRNEKHKAKIEELELYIRQLKEM